ncbi:hypothetical protein AOQ84DRAFT_226702 [Glonium stellatum]|uniref:NACHT-NTPase and P-loop NTPases N-terminal domain-containing protein n=1 Tax=Glonium stellatum TaxID=574774 RepID=A0A8E2JNN0_9PEZI|nr:hypothetical protein AOQ84DRAFT_226702 [Glonium stellatum]
MSGTEAGLITRLISGIISIVDATRRVYDVTKDKEGLPQAFREVAQRLPLVYDTLQTAKTRIEGSHLDNETSKAIGPIVEACGGKVKKLNKLFQEVIPQEDDSRANRYFKAVHILGKGSQVEALMKGILQDLQLLTSNYEMKTSTEHQVKELVKAIAEVSAIPSSVLEQILQDHNSDSSKPSRPERPPKPTTTIPFRRDPDFVGRGLILSLIYERCSVPGARITLTELGGVGKSQLAIEFSYRIRERSPLTWVFWVHGSNAARFEEGYRAIADAVKLPGRDKPQADILQLVYTWLCSARSGKWVIVLDDADISSVFFNPHAGGVDMREDTPSSKVQSLSAFLPQTHNGAFLITTRDTVTAFRFTGRAQDIIKIEPMDHDDALALLDKKLRGYVENDSGAELVQALDYIPLAITQAAAYIYQRAPRSSVAMYLRDLFRSDRSQASLLNYETGDLWRDYSASNSIIATWRISFEHIYATRPSAAELLSLMSFFDRQGIPKSLLQSDNQRADASENGFEEDLAVLLAFSIISANVQGDLFEMHRLVQLSTRRWLEVQGQLEIWKQKYIIRMSKAFPTAHYENWSTCQRLFPHAVAAVAQRPADDESLTKWAYILNNARCILALVLRSQGEYKGAEEMNQRALEGCEKALGKEHPTTLASVSNLALVLQDQGKYKQAEEISRRALEGCEKVLGIEHSATLTSVSNLALVLQNQEKVLRDQKNNLASVLRYQGKYKQAEEMYWRALEGREKVLGRERPDALTSVNNPASVLRYQGKYKQADEMNRRALEWCEKVLGEEHPTTLTSVSDLALVLQDQGKYEQAEEMSRRALKWCEKVLGIEHSATLTSVSNLALVLKNQGKVLQDQENNLALVLQDQGKYEQAEEMSRRALKGRQKVLGNKHSDTLRSLTNLAYALRSQGRWREAEELQTQATNNGGVSNLELDHPSLDLDSDTWPINIMGNADALSGESSSASFAWSGQPNTTTAPSSFPLASVPDSKGATSLGHLAKKSDAHQDSDIQSVVSVDEDILSTDESNSSSSEARQAAGDYLVEKFTDDDELRTLYQEAMQGLDEARFIRNNRRSLKLYFIDLNSEGQTPSDKLATKFLRPRSERIRISNKICRFLMPSENSVRDRIDDKLRIAKVGLYLANQRLVLENSATNVVNQLVDQEGMDNTDATSEASEDSNNSANTENEESINEISTELVHAELEAAAKFLTSGWPFRLYKERFRNFLYQQRRPKEFSTQHIRWISQIPLR